MDYFLQQFLANDIYQQLQYKRQQIKSNNSITTAADTVLLLDNYESYLTITDNQWEQFTQLPLNILESIRSFITKSILPIAANTINNQLQDQQEQELILSTGCISLNNLLSGGLYTGLLTELLSASSCGKTQLCMQIAFNTALSSSSTNRIIYFDTSQSFNVNRIKELYNIRERIERNSAATAQAAAATTPAATESTTMKPLAFLLQQITVNRSYTIYELLDQLESIRIELSNPINNNNNNPIRLIIIDSIPALFQPILGNNTRGHTLMTILIRLLRSLAIEYNLSVVITNQLVSEIPYQSQWRNSSSSNPTFKAALGETWQYVSDVRLELTAADIPPNTNQSKSTVTTVFKQLTIELTRSPHSNTGKSIQCNLTNVGIQ